MASFKKVFYLLFSATEECEKSNSAVQSEALMGVMWSCLCLCRPTDRTINALLYRQVYDENKVFMGFVD